MSGRPGARREADDPSSPASVVLRPEGWPRPSGYSEGVAARGTALHVAGQVGWDPLTHMFATQDFARQAAQALDNVLAVVRAGGGEARHVVRLTWYVTSLADYTAARAALGAAFRERFAGHYPATSLVQVAGLLEAGALLEIEATAIVP